MNNSPVTIPAPSVGSLEAGDPRIDLAHATQVARRVMERVDAVNGTNQSPCPEWDARLVAGHIIAVLERIAGFAEGKRHEELSSMTDVPAEELMSHFDRAAHHVESVWSDDAVLDRILILPFAELPGAVAARIYTSELLVHAWDLATAIGVTVEWPEALVEQAVAVITQGIPPERGDDVPFDDVVPTDSSAAPVERLVAWVGRDPRAHAPQSA